MMTMINAWNVHKTRADTDRWSSGRWRPCWLYVEVVHWATLRPVHCSHVVVAQPATADWRSARHDKPQSTQTKIGLHKLLSCANFPDVITQRQIFYGGVRTPRAYDPKFELGRHFCTPHLPPSFIILCLLVRKLSCWQTNKQTPMKTSNALRYTTTLRNYTAQCNVAMFLRCSLVTTIVLYHYSHSKLIQCLGCFGPNALVYTMVTHETSFVSFFCAIILIFKM